LSGVQRDAKDALRSKENGDAQRRTAAPPEDKTNRACAQIGTARLKQKKLERADGPFSMIVRKQKPFARLGCNNPRYLRESNAKG
jgi:hypothetical protein